MRDREVDSLYNIQYLRNEPKLTDAWLTYNDAHLAIRALIRVMLTGIEDVKFDAGKRAGLKVDVESRCE